MALLGEAWVRVRPDTDGFEKEANSKLGGGLKRVAGAVTAAFASVKVGGFLKDAVGEASSFNETVSKTANVFGQKLAPSLQAFAKTAPSAFGISERAALGATAQFGNMFIQLGFTGEAAAAASTNLVKTAADLGSFNDVDPSDVLERIGASLRGEFDSLQQLIPNINAARVEQEALALSGKKVASELTAQEKATATLAIIQKDGALAANDAAETSAGFAFQQRKLTAVIDGLQQRLGQALLPAVTAVTTYLASNAEPAFNRVSAAVETFIGAFRNPEKVSQLGVNLDSTAVAGGKAREVFDKVREALVDAFRTVREGNAELPNFAGLLDVGSAALKLVADNADLVIKALPFLAAGFLVVKTAQAASNVAALASLPIQAGQVLSNIAAARANKALAVAIGQQTAIQNANAVATTRGTVSTIAHTVAETASTAAKRLAAAASGLLTAATTSTTLARAREIVVTTASTVAKGVATVATAALTAATTALGVAVRFAMGPVGLIITGLGLLAAGLVLAYQKSETFRDIVNGALAAVKTAFTGLATGALGVIDKILAGYQAMATAAGKLPGPLGAPFRAAAEAIGVARQGVQALTDKINGVPKNKTAAVKANVNGTDDVQRLGRSIANVNSKTVFLTTVLKTENQRDATKARNNAVPGRQGGGPVRRNFAYMVGEKEPELFVPDQSGTIYNQRQMAGLAARGSAVADVDQQMMFYADVRKMRQAMEDLLKATHRLPRDIASAELVSSRTYGF